MANVFAFGLDSMLVLLNRRQQREQRGSSGILRFLCFLCLLLFKCVSFLALDSILVFEQEVAEGTESKPK